MSLIFPPYSDPGERPGASVSLGGSNRHRNAAEVFIYCESDDEKNTNTIPSREDWELYEIRKKDVAKENNGPDTYTEKVLGISRELGL